ncbi:hypothetical protein ELQ35_16675 [Peribacillus cavernae]|uniref:Uncharacterized protein n=1 Tax=Peribacillus cavernae TaxID=1674310 RepID=A0A433HFS5_9BACI|nr:hypothetical protein [Peribacillus cavernae]MDQ0219825.1 hypothetical protein [Peribacillus cavernae]RUQ27216.1 hypothetical protein ELQ35_16675 [Peribacillus cavernae]
MAKSKNSLLGIAALGTAAYLFRNKSSRDKVMNKIQSLVTPERREKIMDQVRTFTGTNSSTEKYTPQNNNEKEPNSQALSTADTMDQQTHKFLEPDKKDEVTEVKVTK